METKVGLFLDMSTKSSGWCIIDVETHKLIEYGRIEKYQDEESDMRKRVMYMMDNIRGIIDKYKPFAIVMEDVVPTINNSCTVKALAILQGAILGMCHTLKIRYDLVSVSTWHSALGILKKKGDLKEQSIKLTNKLYNINLVYKSKSSKFNEDDISDSILIGCYYLGTYKTLMKNES